MTLETKPTTADLLTREPQKIHFDERTWSVVWGEQKTNISSIEYLPLGQNVNHWHEMIASQFIPGLKNTSARDFASNFLNSLKRTGVIASSKILKIKGNTVFLEFQVQQPQNLQQDELQKIVKTAEGIYLLHYAIKKSDMGPDNRAKWLANLSHSTINMA